MEPPKTRGPKKTNTTPWVSRIPKGTGEEVYASMRDSFLAGKSARQTMVDHGIREDLTWRFLRRMDIDLKTERHLRIDATQRLLWRACEELSKQAILAVETGDISRYSEIIKELQRTESLFNGFAKARDDDKIPEGYNKPIDGSMFDQVVRASAHNGDDEGTNDSEGAADDSDDPRAFGESPS